MPHHPVNPAHSGRRQFLQTALTGAALGVVARAGFEFVAPWTVFAQTKLSPEQALQELLAGNQRYVAGQLTSTKQDPAALRAKTAAKQEPFAAVLACADSRVPVELVFDQSIGQIFVTRVAGNIVTPEIIGSLEFAVAVVGVRVLLVLGHSSCGAVKAAMKGDAAPGQISSLYPHLRGAVEKSGGDLAKAIEANAQIQADLLRTSSPVIRDAVKEGTLKVVAGVYDLASGKVALS